jgi:hypothetical protein
MEKGEYSTKICNGDAGRGRRMRSFVFALPA